MGMRIVKNSVITLAATAALFGGIAQSFGAFAGSGTRYHTAPTHVRADDGIRYHNAPVADGTIIDVKYRG
jgi:hypothetical protein